MIIHFECLPSLGRKCISRFSPVRDIIKVFFNIEQRKVFLFVPLVSLTHGRWNGNMKYILQRSAESWMRRQGVPENTGTWNNLKSILMTQWWQELSSRLQKGNLRVLQVQYNKAFRGTREPRRHVGGDIRTMHISDATQRTISSTIARISSQTTSSIGSILQAIPTSSMSIEI